MDKGARDRDHARVRIPTSHFWRTVSFNLYTHVYVEALQRCRVYAQSGSLSTPWQSTVIPAPPLAHATTLPLSALERLVISRPTRLGISAQIQGVWGYLQVTLECTFHNHRSLDGIAVMVVIPDRVERRRDAHYWGRPERRNLQQ